MKQKVFSVRDAKAEAFLPPFYQPTIGAGIRVFNQAINTPGTEFNKYFEDYALYQVGEFDPSNGKLECKEQPFQVSTGFDEKEAQEPQTMPLFDTNTTQWRRDGLADEVAAQRLDSDKELKMAVDELAQLRKEIAESE